MDTEGGQDFYDSKKINKIRQLHCYFGLAHLKWDKLVPLLFVLMYQLDTFEDFKLLHVLSHNTIESEFDLNRKIFLVILCLQTRYYLLHCTTSNQLSQVVILRTMVIPSIGKYYCQKTILLGHAFKCLSLYFTSPLLFTFSDHCYTKQKL